MAGLREGADVAGKSVTGTGSGRPEAYLWWLRLEGLCALVAACAAYHALGEGWWWFAGLFFVPDVTMAGYAFGPRRGAAIYNAGHSYVGPALLLGVHLTTGLPLGLPLALIWAAHIGLDRALGFGLKRAGGFRQTHLQQF